MTDDLRCTWVRGHLQQVVAPEAAQPHPNELAHNRCHVPHRDQHPLEPSVQPAVRKRQEHVQEENRQHDVECLPDGVGDIICGPRQRRDEHEETGNDHQRSEAARWTPSPRDEPTEDVGDRDPDGQQGDDQRLAELRADGVVRQRQRD